MIEQVEKLEDILTPYHGQTVWCSDEDKVYRYDAVEGWQEVPQENGAQMAMNMYDINKQIISQLSALSEEELQERKRMIVDFVNAYNNVFYMLLCRDINYYTLFSRQHTNYELLEDIMIDECLPQIGQIKSIELTQDEGAIEIWLQDEENNVYVAYFFPYDAGVIVCT